MSVLIEGMEMPISCWDCLLNTYGYCMASDEHSDIIPSDAPIPDWCPLTPVPPHGRLIDADALKISTAVPLNGKPYRYVHIENIENAPTIIPAEEG